ncbi:hypothetical protein [Celeribacter baekdonensis]|uniref:Uncharacterized protein n=1 Tax=Celeribacter baekdonensis TaxID=875171 RepID=A0A2R4M2D0_9RHOB|nr:hypothetical protein [Celeribacter baekdonensis]AVW91364.1 hypothetical protein DA792_09945 [Celeribacter baekdonensis]
MFDGDEPKYFSFEERQKQKALSRARDEERLARGEISAMELQRENMPFRKLRRDRVALFRSKRTGEFVWISLEPKPSSQDGNDD